jgi:hypothetical protein
VFQKSHCDYGTNQAISTTSGFTLLLHNQRLKPDKEKPDHVWAGRGVGRQLSGKAKRVSTGRQ